MPADYLLCDGCGQLASPTHIARRLQRLEWTTRYRPIHIATLLLGAVSPEADADFLYAGQFEGAAARLLEVTGLDRTGRSAEAILSEFQRGGYFLANVLECPLEAAQDSQSALRDLLEERGAAVIARIRRSLKPKRVVLISEHLTPFVERLTSAELGCPVILDGNRPFALDSSVHSEGLARVRELLSGAAPVR
jgi:hypothetical protein